jgi:hypothetical protein
MTRARIQPNSQPPPRPIGNANGLIVPDTAPNPKPTTAPPIKPTEKEKGWWERWGSAVTHGVLDVVGLIPGVGEIADGANALIYLAEGDKVNAALSAAAMIPGAGMAATGAKYTKKAVGVAAEAGTKVAKEGAEKVIKKEADDVAEAAGKNKKGGKDKGKGKPKCGGRGTYAKQEGDFAGNGMERDHIPSFAAMKKAFEKWAKKNGHDLDTDPELRKNYLVKPPMKTEPAMGAS